MQSRNKDCCFSFIKKRRKRKLSQSGIVLEINNRPIIPLIEYSEDPSAQLRLGPKGHKHGGDLLEHSNISPTTLYIDSLLADRPASRISGSAKRPDQVSIPGRFPNSIAFELIMPIYLGLVDGYIWPEPQYLFLPGKKSSLYQRKARA